MRLLLILFFPLITYGQKNCVGSIVDKISGKGIPYATLGLIKENKGVSTDEFGNFNISSSFPKIDCLRISSVGYKTMILPVLGFVNGRVIALQQEAAILKDVIISASRQKRVYILNRFKRCSGNSYGIGPETICQLAQRFEAPKPQMQLTDLELCKDGSKSIFRLRIYNMDPIHHFPTNDLADTVIDVRSSGNRVRINLENYNIIIPDKSFFVAIEWLFVPYNEDIQEQKRKGRKAINVYYRPFIRWIRDRNAKKGNVWLLHFNGKWSEIYASSQDHNFQITAKLR